MASQPAESVEVRIARMEERMGFLARDAEEASKARKSQYEATAAVQSSVDELTRSVQLVTDTLAGQKPTIEEFITIKHKVVGAGKLGRWLWIAGAFLLGTAANLREHLLIWLK